MRKTTAQEHADRAYQAWADGCGTACDETLRYGHVHTVECEARFDAAGEAALALQAERDEARRPTTRHTVTTYTRLSWTSAVSGRRVVGGFNTSADAAAALVTTIFGGTDVTVLATTVGGAR